MPHHQQKTSPRPPLPSKGFSIIEPQKTATMTLVLTANKDKDLRQQMQELLNRKARRRKIKWNLFFGKVQFDTDPVDYQRNLRDE
jgi:hypothetical protein